MSETQAQSQLRAFVERIERMHEERAGIGEDLKNIYVEAKSNGFDTKVIKKIVSDRAKDPNDLREFNAIYELYADQLGMTVATRATATPSERMVKVTDNTDADGHRLTVSVDPRIAEILNRKEEA